MMEVVPMVSKIGDIATIAGFICLIYNRVINYIATPQLCGVMK